MTCTIACATETVEKIQTLFPQLEEQWKMLQDQMSKANRR